MWIGYLPPQPKTLEIVLSLSIETQIGGLKLWNYNKSSIDCTKCIKEISIHRATHNEQTKKDESIQLWQGNLERGRGQTNVEYATVIKFIEGIEIPKEI